MKVALLSLPPRTQAVLEFFFTSAGRASFLAVDEAQAEVAIFDQDHLASREHWARFSAAHQRPGIALAVQEQVVAGAVWVHKPVTPAALMSAAAKLRAAPPTALSTVPEAAPVPAASAPASASVPAAPASVSVPPVADPVPSPVAPKARAEGARSPSAPTAPLIERVARVAAPSSTLRRDEGAEAHHETLNGPSTQALIEPMFDGVPPPMPSSARPSASVAPSVPPLPEPVAPPTSRGLGGLLRRWIGGRPETPVRAASAVSPASVAPSRPMPVSPTVSKVAPPTQPAPDDRSGAQATTIINPAAVPVRPPSPAASTPLLDGSGLVGGIRVAPAAEMIDEPLLCGSREDLDPAAIGSRQDLRYNLESMLLSALTEAYLVGAKWQVPTQVELSQGTLVVDTTQNVAYLDLDPSRWADLLTRPMIRRPKTRAVSRQEFVEMSERWKDRVTVLRLDQLLWRSGLETSVGRLPNGVNPSKTIYLKHWPNLTRLHQTPHGMRIAALWATRGASLLETASTLRVAQRHVFAFYNAAVALDLVTEDGAHVRRQQRKGTKNKGLLSKLFGWLQK